jgi:hypothetical protein
VERELGCGLSLGRGPGQEAEDAGGDGLVRLSNTAMAMRRIWPPDFHVGGQSSTSRPKLRRDILIRARPVEASLAPESSGVMARSGSLDPAVATPSRAFPLDP